MKFEILGKEKVDYVSRRTGQPVKGTNLHCTVLEGGKTGVEGVQVERLYVKETIDCSALAVGDAIDVYYNRFGSVDSIHLA